MSGRLPSHEAVIVFKNGRVARDTKLYFYYLYTLEKRNVKLLSTEEHFSEGDDFANIYRFLLMFVAEQERKNIALRTGRGRSIKAKCGGYAGGNKPYGYYCADGMLILNRREKLIVEAIFREYDKIALLYLIFATFYTIMDIELEKASGFSRPPFVESYRTAFFMMGCINMETWAGYKVYTPRFSHWRCRNEENPINYSCWCNYANNDWM